MPRCSFSLLRKKAGPRTKRSAGQTFVEHTNDQYTYFSNFLPVMSS